MVTTASSYADQRGRAFSGQGYDGVVRVSSGGYFGTGVLLYGGQAVLTAAHLFANSAAAASVHFETSSGAQTVSASSVTILSGYEPGAANNDLALVWLSTGAPTTANRYAPYRGSDEIGQTMTLVGYGLAGSGDAGTTSADTGAPVRLKAANQFDADAAALKSALGVEMGWTPLAGSQLVADFDNGGSAQDALGRLIAHPGTGLGLNEGLIAPGDSGGPAFINGSIAGIASYTASLQNGATNPDIDAVSNSSFGEIGAWQRVSHYQQWIDQSLRAHYPNAPGTPQQVQKSVAEGGSGTTYAYFLLQFTGVRSDPSQLLSVDYTTRDGSAEAGSDYLAAKGTLRLYPGENQAVIAVEIIGDALAETDETFYLDVTNPVGGSFGPDVVTLTAMRTIVNDDGGIWT
ncbi:MAG: trypsin-like serine protease [Telluria sp.]|nr:trypsin-like serine protease [Telluria sp.]